MMKIRVSTFPAHAALLMALACAMPAEAGERQTTPSMTCSELRALVRTQGAVVLYTGPHLYDRYVDHAGYCPTMMRTKAAWVPAKDTEQCFIGFTCEQPNFFSRR